MAAALPYIAAATGIAGAVSGAKAANAAQDQASQAGTMQKYALANAKQYQPVQNTLQGILQTMMGMNAGPAPTAPTAPTRPTAPSRRSYATRSEYDAAKRQYSTAYSQYRKDLSAYNTANKAYQTQLSAYGKQLPNQPLPSWMNIDWTQPFTDEQLNTMRQSNIQSAQDITDAAKANTYADLVRRGAIGEGATSSLEDNASFRNELFGRQMQNQAALDTQNAVIGRGDQLRGEQNVNWQNLVNIVRNNPSQQMVPWAQMAYNQAGQYGQQAGNILGGLGQIAANWPQRAASTNVSVNTSGAGGYQYPSYQQYTSPGGGSLLGGQPQPALGQGSPGGYYQPTWSLGTRPL